ncbi:hypothetical protein RMO59_10165 [Streptomyces alfalfae]
MDGTRSRAAAGTREATAALSARPALPGAADGHAAQTSSARTPARSRACSTQAVTAAAGSSSMSMRDSTARTAATGSPCALPAGSTRSRPQPSPSSGVVSPCSTETCSSQACAALNSSALPHRYFVARPCPMSLRA